MAVCGWPLLAKILGVSSFIVLVIGGILTIISVIPLCWGIGAYMIVVGIFVGIMETPFLFEKIDCTKALTEKLKKIGPGARCIVYILSIIAAILLIATGFVYGLVFLGPRGRDASKQPPAAITEGEGAPAEDKEQLIAAEEGAVRILHQRANVQGKLDSDWTKPVTEAAGKAAGKAVVASLASKVFGGDDSKGSKGGKPAWAKAGDDDDNV